jgi:hypothetical protein
MSGQHQFEHAILYLPFRGGVVQLVRTPACHAGGRGFESHRLRHISTISINRDEKPSCRRAISEDKRVRRHECQATSGGRASLHQKARVAESHRLRHISTISITYLIFLTQVVSNTARPLHMPQGPSDPDHSSYPTSPSSTFQALHVLQ